jgi:hypothetical protein
MSSTKPRATAEGRSSGLRITVRPLLFSLRLCCLRKFEPFEGNLQPYRFVLRIGHFLGYVGGFFGSLAAIGGVVHQIQNNTSLAFCSTVKVTMKRPATAGGRSNGLRLMNRLRQSPATFSAASDRR